MKLKLWEDLLGMYLNQKMGLLQVICSWLQEVVFLFLVIDV